MTTLCDVLLKIILGAMTVAATGCVIYFGWMWLILTLVAIVILGCLYALGETILSGFTGSKVLRRSGRIRGPE